MSRPVVLRVLVYGLLAAVLACGFFTVEAWPLTGWRLFSVVRGPTQGGWIAKAVNIDGREESIDFGGLGRGYTGALHLMIEMPRRRPADRLAVCQTWFTALRDRGEPIAAVRIYRTRTAVPRRAAPARVLQRTLYLECST